MTSATGKRTIELTTRKTQKTRESARRSIPAHLASGAGEGPAGLGRPASPIGRGRGGRLPETNRAPSWSATRAATQAITTGADMAAGGKRREVGRLSPISTSVLHRRASSGWWRDADLSKYCWRASH